MLNVPVFRLAVFSLLALNSSAAELRIGSPTLSGQLSVSNTFTNGVLTLRHATVVDGPWPAIQNIFTTSTVSQLTIATNPGGFLRAEALDLSPIRPGFTNFTRAYGVLTTIAGLGGPQDVNNWRPEYEGGPATAAVLSGPHMAMADRAGFIYIADKDAHAIRKILHDGTIVTVAGTSAPGNARKKARVRYGSCPWRRNVSRCRS